MRNFPDREVISSAVLSEGRKALTKACKNNDFFVWGEKLLEKKFRWAAFKKNSMTVKNV